MFSRKQILSALKGVAMLALPVSAFAAHHDNPNHRKAFVTNSSLGLE
jgi:hypothetical protein